MEMDKKLAAEGLLHEISSHCGRVTYQVLVVANNVPTPVAIMEKVNSCVCPVSHFKSVFTELSKTFNTVFYFMFDPEQVIAILILFL
ncbi:hypothetical protein DsansV1_C19g0158131 [Dioscorea sansibarensis]